jgi:hypothetical protein
MNFIIPRISSFSFVSLRLCVKSSSHFSIRSKNPKLKIAG